MKGKEQIHIGTSGWHYDHWKGPFYPHELYKKNFLEYYAERFTTAEINNSFYRLPSTQTLRSWRDTVPERFVFTAKASRYITHMKKLKDPEEPVSVFFRAFTVLGDKLGPILFQLPPHWHFNPKRLDDFLGLLPPDYQYAFEFRDETWFNDEAYSILAENGAAFCIYELAGRQSPKEVTADFIYVRLHGPNGAYQGRYTKGALSGWAGAFSTWADQGKVIYCYFDNDEAGYAAENALELEEMVRED
ncbi:MAG: DUF72 domain-containing protein [Thermodesulfobacteriota bacterium]